MNTKKGIMLLFQRPLEPIFTTRDNGKTVFDVPESFYTDQYKSSATSIENRFGSDVDTKITLRDVPKPDLSFAAVIGKKNQFSLFNDTHKRVAGRLIKIFLDARDADTFLSIAAYAKDRLNPLLFQYALSVAVQHRSDTKDYDIPTVLQLFPAQFVDPSVLPDGRREANVIANPGDRMRIEIPINYTASSKEDEQLIAYFREDIGINMHHWHWHLVYPTQGPDQVVNKDRRGELFYHMHHQIQARYNAERFAHRLPRVRPITNWREPLSEGYYPKLLSSITNRTYPSRPPGSLLKDVEREGANIEIGDLDRWRDRIYQAIDQGFIVDSNGRQIPLDEVKGIDILGNIIESSQLTPNRQLYGDVHNQGHNIISFIHDPDFRYLEDFGVIADVTTAMRDPAFYRLHQFVDAAFIKFKNTLPQYSPQQLGYEGVIVDSVDARLSVGQNVTPNLLLTYWQKSDVDIGAALDFGPNGNVLASFQHLQNAPFNYRIQVTNQSNAVRLGTCRIFLIPRFDERGNALNFEDRRLLAIEMDKFTVNLKPGSNIVMRRSDESNITIPYERTFRRVGARDQPTNADQLAEFRFCGCGWPQHMLLPKGTQQGMQFDLYVMISNYNDDFVQQPSNAPDVCGDAASFCGLKDKLFPDKRAMGYPFDRVYSANTMNDFVNQHKNMGLQEIRIKFNDTVVNRA